MEEIIVQRALDQTGFGRFNLKITALCALIYLNCSFTITSVGFVIPTAACDFRMTTLDKGRINAAPMLGMLFGSGIWSYFADIKGRRTSLVLSLVVQWVVDLLASVIPSYWAFVCLKFISGIGVTGQLSILFTYLGEFQPVRKRHQILSWMEMAWAVGITILPIFAWIIIPLKFKYKSSFYMFSSWNLFVFLSALPGIFITLWLMTLPETPKYLAENGRQIELLEVLTQMFVENTGGSAKEYEEKLVNLDIPSISALVMKSKEEIKSEAQTNKVPTKQNHQFRQLIATSKAQTKSLMRKPYLKRICLTSAFMFFTSSTYYSLMTWFPELFQRFAAFEVAHPDETESICTISKRTNITVHSHRHTTSEFGCDVPIDTSVYLNSIFLGVACMPGAICLPLTVDKLGYRVYLTFTTLIAGSVTIGMLFVESSVHNLILSCIFEAFTSLALSVVFCLMVELFPTNLRVMASAITVLVGRAGSLFGSMLFTFLIDEHCVTLILIMASQLLVSTTMSWATPGRKKLKKLQQLS